MSSDWQLRQAAVRRLALSVVAAAAVGSAASTAGTIPKRESDPAPAGAIVFTRKDSGRPSLYVMRPIGSGARLLIRNAAEAAISPDGRRMAFVRNDEIWVMRLDGSGQRQQWRVSAPPTGRWNKDREPAWSADGGAVYFSRFEVEHNNEVSASIFSVRADGKRLRRLITAAPSEHGECHGDPAPSPNGRIVAYDDTECEHGGSGGIRAVFVTGKPAPILGQFSSDVWAFDPAWSPHGRFLAFAAMDLSGEGGYVRSGIYVARVDGFGSRRVYDASGSVPGLPWPAGWPSAPAWSPDGRWLAFASDISLPNGSAGEIFIVRSDGSGLQSITKTKASDEQDPVWSGSARFR